MKKNLLIINTKTYSEATGDKLISLAKICDELITKYDANITLAVQPFDLIPVMQATRFVKVASQHIDPFEPGRNTGFLVPENIRSIGITTTILNHSEHKLPFRILRKSIGLLRKNKFEIILCADTVREAKHLAELKPDFIAVEPPELIGGNISVTNKPSIIVRSLKAVGSIPLLVGAGIKSGSDVKKAIELGASGVLVASGVVLAKNKKKIIKEFIDNF